MQLDNTHGEQHDALGTAPPWSKKTSCHWWGRILPATFLPRLPISTEYVSIYLRFTVIHNDATQDFRRRYVTYITRLKFITAIPYCLKEHKCYCSVSPCNNVAWHLPTVNLALNTRCLFWNFELSSPGSRTCRHLKIYFDAELIILTPKYCLSWAPASIFSASNHEDWLAKVNPGSLIDGTSFMWRLS